MGSYGFLVFLMIETAMIRQPWLTEAADQVVFYCSIAWLGVYNIFFGWYGWWLRQDEAEKLNYSSDQVEAEVNLSRPALRFDYTKRMRSGENGRLLSFIAYTVASHHMDDKQKAILQQKQEAMDSLYRTHTMKQASKHGYDLSEIPQSPSATPAKS